MNKPKRNSDAKLITVSMAMERYNLCRGNVMTLSREAGALIKYGRLVLGIDKQTLLDYVKGVNSAGNIYSYSIVDSKIDLGVHKHIKWSWMMFLKHRFSVWK